MNKISHRMRKISNNYIMFYYTGLGSRKKSIIIRYIQHTVKIEIGYIYRSVFYTGYIFLGYNDIKLCYELLNIIDDFLSKHTYEDMCKLFEKINGKMVRNEIDIRIIDVLNRCMEYIK